MRKLFASCVVVLAISMSLAPSASATDKGPSVLVESTVWEEEDSPFELKGNIQVASGVTLEIEPGVVVEAQGDYKIQVAGKLLAEGDATAPVVFTCVSSKRDCWGGIEFLETQSGSTLENVEVTRAKTGLSANATPYSVTGSWFHYNTTGISASGGTDSEITENAITENTTGASITFKVAEFERNSVVDNKVGLSMVGDNDKIRHNNIYGNSDLAIDACGSVGREDFSIDASDNYWGTTDADDIEDAICHKDDDEVRPEVDYEPFATDRVEGAAVVPGEDPEPSPSPSSSPSPSPSASPDEPVEESRSVSLFLGRHLKARGSISGTADSACVVGAVVQVQRRAGSSWRTVKRVLSSETGSYRTGLRDRRGAYRVVTPRVEIGDGLVCMRAVSAIARHRH